MRRSILVVAFIAGVQFARADGLPETGPIGAGFDGSLTVRIDDAVNGAIGDGAVPGAVVLVGRNGKIAHWKAYGLRWNETFHREAMTRDTIFDLASLTKPIATATTILHFVDSGRFQLDSQPSQFFPEFGSKGKDEITIEQLLRHRSGLIADNPLADYLQGKDTAWQKLAGLPLTASPGSKFLYSDVGFMVLAKLIGRLDEAADRFVFRPVGMHNTAFLAFEQSEGKALALRAIWVGRFPVVLPLPVPSTIVKASPTDSLGRVRSKRPVAPTERQPPGSFTSWVGVVHDPRARALGGVAGHAGLFAPADDLALYAQMLLDGGKSHEGKVILKSETVEAMISPGDTPPGEKRGLGWDIETPYSSPRGRHFGPRSFGHTGFTGTSLWIDPESRCFVILLTSRLHPDGKGKSPSSLRSKLATITSEALIDKDR